ncbi:MAG: Glutamyl-tRNA reductase [Verrucomicrobiales bacterium]|nr:Glutamyl-tRNA reductase [Verrucomicrobiales bacterium]
MIPFVAGLSFKTAPVHVREQIAVAPANLRCTACKLKVNAGLSEIVLLSTCNRVEVYGVAPQHRIVRLLNCLSNGNEEVSSHLYVHEGEEAARHLFSVISGLDSMVLGETEITGQVKHAYQTAQEAGLTGRVMNCLFQKALQTAKEVRTRTLVGRGATSVGSVAVQLADKIFDAKLGEKTVMIIGAGKMGEACVRHLAKKGARSVIVSNRSIERAQDLAKEFNGRAVRLDDCKDALAEADIVVSSTGCPDMVLTRADVEAAMQKRRNRPLFLIDIAVPRDIDPAVQHIENVYLYNIDALQEVMCENARLREQELSFCRSIVEARTAEVMIKLTPRKMHEKNRSQSEPAWGFCQPMVACS